MALNDIQAVAMDLIQNDPQAFRLMQEELRRIDPEGKKIPKTALPDIALNERIEEVVKPLREKNEKLEKELREKKEYDDHQFQRDFMRRKYHMTDAQIDELATWMKEDADGNIYQSYEAAHKYREAMRQPIIPNGASSPNPVSRLTGRQVRNSEQEPWREDIAKRRRESGGPRAQERAKAREQWAKTMQELRTNRP